MITLFAMPKPFEGHIGTIQRNALMSWKLLPQVEVILFGTESGVAEIAQELGYKHVKDVARNEHGTPFVHDLFQRGQTHASHSLYCYCNADVILYPEFTGAILACAERFDKFLMIGQRWDIEQSESIDFRDPQWSSLLRRKVSRDGILHNPAGIDFFAFNKNVWREIPPFALGRVFWDNWLVQGALENNAALIDATEVLFAIHQNHDYAHVGGRHNAWNGEEAQYNKRVGKMGDHLFNVTDSTWRLLPTGFIPAAKGRRPSAQPVIDWARLMDVATNYIEQNQPQKVVELVEPILQAYPKQPELNYLHAIALFHLKRFDEALNACQRELQNVQISPHTLQLLDAIRKTKAQLAADSDEKKNSEPVTSTQSIPADTAVVAWQPLPTAVVPSAKTLFQHPDHIDSPLATLLDLSPTFWRGKRVLEIGPGPFHPLKWAISAIRKTSVRLSNAHTPHPSDVECIISNAGILPLRDQSFDFVYCVLTDEYAPYIDTLIREIARVCASRAQIMAVMKIAMHSQEVYTLSTLSKFNDDFLIQHEELLNCSGNLYHAIERRIQYQSAEKEEPYAVWIASLFRKSTPVAIPQPQKPCTFTAEQITDLTGNLSKNPSAALSQLSTIVAANYHHVRAMNQLAPVITVAIPVYNREQFLAITLQSVLEQQCDVPFEVVIVDDGSTDRSMEVAKSFIDNRIRIIQKQKTNAPDTRNHCIAGALGEWILWVDSDDILLPNALQTLWQAAMRRPDCMAICGDTITIDEQLNNKGTLYFESWRGRRDELIRMFMRRNPIPLGNMLIKKQVFTRFGKFDPDFLRGHDMELWSRIASEVTFDHVPAETYIWRHHSGCMSPLTLEFSASENRSTETRVALRTLKQYSIEYLFPDFNWKTDREKSLIAAWNEASQLPFIARDPSAIEWCHTQLQMCLLQAKYPDRKPNEVAHRYWREIGAITRQTPLFAPLKVACFANLSEGDESFQFVKSLIELSKHSIRITLDWFGSADDQQIFDHYEPIFKHINANHVLIHFRGEVDTSMFARYIRSAHMVISPLSEPSQQLLDIAWGMAIPVATRKREASLQVIHPAIRWLKSGAEEWEQLLLEYSGNLERLESVRAEIPSPIEYFQTEQLKSTRLPVIPVDQHASMSGNSPQQRTIALFAWDKSTDACGKLRIEDPLANCGDFKIIRGFERTKDFSKSLPFITGEITPDLVIWQRHFVMVAEYAPPELIATFDRWKQAGIPFLYELDDDFSSIPTDNPNAPFFARFAPSLQKYAHYFSAISVTTEQLASRMKSLGVPVYTIPNYINERAWKLSSPLKCDHPETPVTIGWMGTPTHASDIAPILPALKRVLCKFGDRVRLQFYGWMPSQCSSWRNCELVFRMNDQYVSFIHQFIAEPPDIAIAPLQDIPFNQSKSDIKFLEYAAVGAAGVYTNLPPYNSVVDPGNTGLLAGSGDVDAWYQALVQLIESTTLRNSIAKNAREYVAKHRTIEQHYDEWKQLYDNLLNQHSNHHNGVKVQSVDHYDTKTLAAFIVEPITNACPQLRVFSQWESLPNWKVEQALLENPDGTRRLNHKLLESADAVLFQRHFARVYPQLESYLKAHISNWQSKNIPVLYELDDNFFDVGADHSDESYFRSFESEFNQMAPFLTGISCTSSELKKRLSQFSLPVHVIPHRLHPDLWRLHSPLANQPESPIIIGWMGTPTHRSDLEWLLPVFQQLLTTFGEKIRLQFFGTIPDELKSNPLVEFRGASIPEYRRFVASFLRRPPHIGLAPLSDTKFNRAKSDIKFLEYAAAGVAGVYADLPPYQSSVQHQETGLLVSHDKPSEWLEAIQQLILNDELRNRISRNAREYVIHHRSLATPPTEWLQLLHPKPIIA